MVRKTTRGLLVRVGVVLAALAAGGVAAVAQEPPPGELPPCVEKAPCVYVDPDPEAAREVGREYVFRGQGWRPGHRVTAGYSEFCPPDAYCDNGSRRRRVVPDAGGRFELRIWYDPRDGDPVGVSFSQRRGRRGEVRRDAIATPPPSTPAERAQAAALAATARRAHRAVRAREAAVRRAAQRYVRTIRRCRALDEGRLKERHAVVADALLILAFDEVVHRTLRPQLDAFAVELERAPPADPALRAGADAWIAAIRRARPWPSPSACAVMRRWEEAGYARDQRPVDPDAGPRQTFEYEVASSDALRAARTRLRGLAAGRRNAMLFGGELLDRGDR